jgi:hypothetical protein
VVPARREGTAAGAAGSAPTGARAIGQDTVNQMRGALRHAATATARTQGCLHEKATSRSSPHALQRKRAKPPANQRH